MNLTKIVILIYLWICFPFISKGQQITSDQVLSKKVSVNFQNETIETYLTYLSEAYKIQFSYITADIPLKDKKTIVQNESFLGGVLVELFKDDPIDFLAYEDQIILVKREDIEYLENLKQEGKKKIYVPYLVQSGAEQSTNKGNFIDLNKLLVLLKKVYLKPKNDAQSKKEQDSTRVDSVFADGLKGKKRKIKFPGISFKDVNITYGIVTEFSGAFWFSQSQFDNKDYDQNKVPDLILAAGMDFLMEDEIFLSSIGFRLQYLSKKGNHKNYYSNTILRDSEFSFTETYQEQYTYFKVPLQFSYILRKPKVTYLIGAGGAVQRLLSSDTEPSYRVYQTQFFTNLNQNSIANPDLSPYFNNRFELILPQEVSIRKWNFSGSLHFYAILKLNSNWKCAVGPKLSYDFLSLYDNSAPVKQYPLQIGINMTFTPAFKFL